MSSVSQFSSLAAWMLATLRGDPRLSILDTIGVLIENVKISDDPDEIQQLTKHLEAPDNAWTTKGIGEDAEKLILFLHLQEQAAEAVAAAKPADKKSGREHLLDIRRLLDDMERLMLGGLSDNDRTSILEKIGGARDLTLG